MVAPDYRPPANVSSSRATSTTRSNDPTPSLVTDPIERIEPGGIRTVDGTLHELDVSCSRPASTSTSSSADALVGPDGRSLEEAWAYRADRLSVRSDPRVSEPVPAQRAERPGRGTSR